MTPFFIALQFLTRLKIVNQTEWSVEDFGKSVVAFPYVGLIIGLILALLYNSRPGTMGRGPGRRSRA